MKNNSDKSFEVTVREIRELGKKLEEKVQEIREPYIEIGGKLGKNIKSFRESYKKSFEPKIKSVLESIVNPQKNDSD